MRFVLVVAGLAFLLVAYQAIQTLGVLDRVERERDTWQRPHDIVQALDVKAGQSVVDFGSGAGYFALRLAPTVGPTGRVIAIDIRRQSLAFLWLRSRLGRAWQLDVVLSDARDPRLPPGPIDAILIVNTFHELTNRTALLRQLSQPLKPAGRLVVADRGPHRASAEVHGASHALHGIDPTDAEAEIRAAGFELVHRNDVFIDRPGDDPWWLMVFRKPLR
jgi:predicted methyltransferase